MAFFHSEAPANGDGVENLYDFYNGIHPVSIHIDMLNSRELVSDFFTILAFGEIAVFIWEEFNLLDSNWLQKAVKNEKSWHAICEKYVHCMTNIIAVQEFPDNPLKRKRR